MSNSFIVGSFSYSGDRYFNAFLCSNFPHFINYSANYFSFDDITDTPEENILMKTQDSNPEVDFYIRAIYLVRDPLDICAEYQIETSGKEKVVNTIKRWLQHISDWKIANYHNEILFIKYEDLIANKDKSLSIISNFFDGIDIEPNESRLGELEASVLEIGKYKNVLSDDDILYIQSQTESILKELPCR